MMIKLSSKTIPALFAMLALFLGAWSATPRVGAFQAGMTDTPTVTGTVSVTEQATAIGTVTPVTTGTGTPAATLETPTGTGTAETPTAVVTGTVTATATPSQGSLEQMIKYISGFSIDPATVTTANVSAADRAFLDAALAQNTAGLQMLQIGARRASRPDVNYRIRDLIKLMTQMHMMDQKLLVALQTNIGGATKTPDLSNVAVLPNTPEGTLGFTKVNLNALFINKVRNVSDHSFGHVFLDVMISFHAMGIETADAGRMSATNPSIQAVALHLAQEESFHLLLMNVLRDRLFFDLNTPLQFPVPPATPTPVPTMTMTSTMVPTVTGTVTGTVSPTGTETVMPTGTETVMPTGTETPTAVFSPTVTETPTEVPTIMPTLSGTGTVTPTP